jgi:hypothetical protein
MVALLKTLGFCYGAAHISAVSAGGLPLAAAAPAESAFHVVGALTSELPLDVWHGVNARLRLLYERFDHAQEWSTWTSPAGDMIKSLLATPVDSAGTTSPAAELCLIVVFNDVDYFTASGAAGDACQVSPISWILAAACASLMPRISFLSATTHLAVSLSFTVPPSIRGWWHGTCHLDTWCPGWATAQYAQIAMLRLPCSVCYAQIAMLRLLCSDCYAQTHVRWCIFDHQCRLLILQQPSSRLPCKSIIPPLSASKHGGVAAWCIPC